MPRLMWARLSPAKRGTLLIAGGTGIGQLVALVSAPLLSRMYSPQDFGVFAVVAAFVVTLGTVSALRFELAVPLPKREEDAYSLVAAGLLSSLVVAAVGMLSVALFGERIAAVFHQPRLMPWLWVVPLAGSFMSGYLVLNQLALRRKRFRAVARRNLFQSVSTVGAQLGGGAVGLKPGGLVLGLSLGHLFGAISLSLGSGLLSPEARRARRAAQIRAVVSRYRRFPLAAGPSGLLNVLGLQLPVILIAYWYGGTVAGWLGFAQRVLALPVALVGTAIGQVYLAELSEAIRTDSQRARHLFHNATRLLVPIGAALLLLTTLLGPWAFSLLFGEEWHESGRYAQALSPGLAAQIIASPLSQTLVVLERQGLQLLWDASRVVLVTLVVAVGAWGGLHALSTIWLVSGVTTFLYGLSWYFNFRCLTSAAVTRAEGRAHSGDWLDAAQRGRVSDSEEPLQ